LIGTKKKSEKPAGSQRPGRFICLKKMIKITRKKSLCGNSITAVIVYAILLFMFLGSCKDKESHFLTVETTQVSFTAGQDKKIIPCSSNAAVTAVSSQPSWCTANVIVGKINTGIEIVVTRNTDAGQERTAMITVSAGKAEAVIEVRQEAAAPFVSIDEKEKVQTFESQSDRRHITVNSNVDFTVSSSAPLWCTAEINKILGGVTVSVTGNDKLAVRTATIAIAAPGVNDVIVTVYQDGFVVSRPGMNVKGWVSCNNTGVAGVVVSDGYEVTTTDADGVYYLSSQKRNGYVFISIPGNYEPPVIDNIPQFFKRLKANVNTEEQANFELTAVNNEKHTVLAVADFHLCNRLNDLVQFSACLTDMNAVINSYQTAGTKTYVLTLGDLSNDVYWYTNKFALPEYANVIKGFKTCVFNTMGNHDNDINQVGDWFTEQKYKDVIGPSWYSFNLGKAHYVVLDNIIYHNNTANPDEDDDDGRYDNGITADQIEWLKKDLSHVADKSAPLIIAMHIPLYSRPNASNSISLSLSNGQELIDCLAGFTNVHVLTGHTHRNFRLNPNSWLMEHNLAAISANWWYTGSPDFVGNHICSDGSVGGYGVYEMNGKDLQWYYKSVGYDRHYQFRTYDRNAIHITAEKYAPLANPTFAALAPTYATPYHTASTANEVLINVFGYDTSWTIEVMEGSVPLHVTRLLIADPLHIISCAFPRLNRNLTLGSSHTSRNTSHIFRVTAQSPTSTLNIKVTDRFGNVYTETMTRPKELTVNMK